MSDVEMIDMDLLPDDRSILQRAVQYLADSCFRTPWRVGAVICFWLISMSIIGWNIQRLSLVDEVAQLERRGFELEDRLFNMQARLQDMDLQRVEADIVHADEVVFQGFPILALWAEQLVHSADRRGLDLSLRLQPGRMSAVAGILEVPMTLNFQAMPQMADKLYVETLSLVDNFVHGQWHVDVLAVRAHGAGQGVTRFEMDIEVWVRDRFGFLEADMLAEESPS